MSTTTNAAEGGEQGRAITRGEERRVRALLRDALDVYPSGINLYWSHDDKRMTSVSIDADGQSFRDLTREEIAKAARAGIVPGADGWCWAPSSSNGPDDDTTARMLGVDIERVRLARERGSKDDQDMLARAGFKPGLYGWQWSAIKAEPPPSWLTAAVLAALPPDGTPVGLVGVYAHVAEHPDYRLCSFAHVDAQCMAVLAALVASGEIEAVEGGKEWRRWGVPEGWAFSNDPEEPGTWRLLPVGFDHESDRQIATGYDNGIWRVYASTPQTPLLASAQESTVPQAKRAALRACHERGVFAAGPLLRPVSAYLDATQPGPDEPVPEHPRGPGADGLVMGAGVEGAPVRIMRDALIAGLAAPAPTRAEQVRHALLAVLARGPVAGLSYVLEALSAEGVQPAPDGREAKQAAREIGATRDGARWSLSEGPPPGWGWVEVNGAHYLAPIGSGEPVADSIANVAWADSLWTVTEMGCDGRAIERGEAGDDEGAQAAALAAARRAGLFARPPAVEVTGDGGPAVLPAVTSQGGEAVVPVAPASPLDALALAICVYPNARVPEVRDALRAWGAALVEQARAPLADTIRALTNRQTVDASGTWRVHGEDGVTVVSEDVLVPHPTDPANARARASATPHATVQASLAQRAYAADAPLLYACWQAAQRVREARGRMYPSSPDSAVGELCDLLASAESMASAGVITAPAYPGPAQPCPACATAERRVAAVEGTCRELDDERAGLQRSLDAAIAAATRAEAKLATLGAEIDALHARWAGAK